MVKVNIQLNSKYFNIVMVVTPITYNHSIKVKRQKSIKNNYNHNNLLVNTQYKKYVNHNTKNIKCGEGSIKYRTFICIQS